MSEKGREISVFFISGDPSGDINTTGIIRRIKHDFPGSRLYGIGGPYMAAEGFEQVMDFEPFNCMGFVEVLKHLPFFLRAKSRVVKMLKQDRPDLVVCVDYSGFNIPVMKKARRAGIPVLWYIAPMIWVWKRKKYGKTLKRYASHIAAILPFEPALFREFTENVSYVGNPVAQRVNKTAGNSGNKGLLLVPGSRIQEIEKNLPLMTEIVRNIKKSLPDLRVTVSKMKSIDESVYNKSSDNKVFNYSEMPLSELMVSSQAAVVVSGTATLEAALAELPHVVLYKTSKITYFIAKRVVKSKYIGLANILAGKSIVPEYIQDDIRPGFIAEYMLTLLRDTENRREMVRELGGIKKMLSAK
ncbi:MAG: lipid-A-disaccharide synthase, partial [Chitinivibrionales bacterium]